VACVIFTPTSSIVRPRAFASWGMLVSTAGSHARVRSTDTPYYPYYARHIPYSTYTAYTLLCIPYSLHNKYAA
jgi:hypothetical protein